MKKIITLMAFVVIFASCNRFEVNYESGGHEYTKTFTVMGTFSELYPYAPVFVRQLESKEGEEVYVMYKSTAFNDIDIEIARHGNPIEITSAYHLGRRGNIKVSTFH